MKKRRGCCKPGFDFRGQASYVTTSLRIAENNTPARINECPLGLVIRESPYLFEVEAIAAVSEHAGMGIFDLPRWSYRASAIYASEKHRIFTEEQESKQLQAQASYGERQLRRISGG